MKPDNASYRFFSIKNHFPAEFCNIQHNFTPAHFLPLPAKLYFVVYSKYFDIKGLLKKKTQKTRKHLITRICIFVSITLQLRLLITAPFQTSIAYCLSTAPESYSFRLFVSRGKLATLISSAMEWLNVNVVGQSNSSHQTESLHSYATLRAAKINSETK